MPSRSESSRTSVSTSDDELRVERARDLVEQHQLGVHRERAGDRDALLLAAREPVRVLLRLLREADPAQQRHRAILRRVARQAERLARRERDVLEHRHVREQVERLEDDADLAAQRR